MVKTTQIAGFNGISIDSISTAALKDILNHNEKKIDQLKKEIVYIKGELDKRGE
jgi:hypothetical protein